MKKLLSSKTHQSNTISMLTILWFTCHSSLKRLIICHHLLAVLKLSTWFLQNALLLKPDKTEAIIFGTRQRLASIQMSAGVSVTGTVVHFAEAVKLLGVMMDPVLTFNQHVTDVVRTCKYHTRALHHIRPLFTVAAAKSIATSIVGARLDYWHCNSLLYGTSECNLDRLQRVQNQLARVVL